MIVGKIAYDKIWILNYIFQITICVIVFSWINLIVIWFDHSIDLLYLNYKALASNKFHSKIFESRIVATFTNTKRNLMSDAIQY